MLTSKSGTLECSVEWLCQVSIAPMRNIDWALLQSFAAVAEHGSLSSAAKALGGSQPTMSRHISTLEETLGVRLFDRTGGGLVLTPTGTALFEDARAMAKAAGRLALTATGRSESLEGTVRITASAIVATYVLPPIIARLREEEPQIAIEIVSSDAVNNLLEREADIAIRMFQPTQAELITRKVGEMHLGMYAAHSYVEKRGEPRGPNDLFQHIVIGDDLSTRTIDGFRRAGLNVDRNFFAVRCDDPIVQWELVLAGVGVGFNQTNIGDQEPRVKRLVPDRPIHVLPIWLTAHAELRTSRRVRRVYDFLAEALAEIFG
jgi:DNA-binding transcriptional LysR family regulator